MTGQRSWVRGRLLSLVAAAALLASLLPGCARQVATRPSVILIGIDTLRPDHLSCYGYPRTTSAAIDALSGDSLLYTNASASAPSTLPSFASLFTSLLPQHHGASVANQAPLPAAVLTLAEVMRGAGYRTAAFTGGGQLHSEFGFSQGFEVYQEAFQDLADAVDAATSWLDGLAEEPFFLFLHTYEVHHPYEPAPPLLERFAPDYHGKLPPRISIELLRAINAGEIEVDEEDLDYVVSAYDAEILAMDRSVARVVAELRSRGLYDRSLVVFTSDHGEEFGEHGQWGWHSHTLYEELLRVPLLVKLPHGQLAGTRVETTARLIDLAPTITDVAGIATPAEFEGVSLVGERRHGAVPIVALIDHAPPAIEALRLDRWKWFNGRLFDLQADPGELDDVAAREPDIAARLAARLKEIVSEREAPQAEGVEPGQDTRDQLRALGYLD